MQPVYGLYYEETNRFGNCNREVLCVGTKLELKIILNKLFKDMNPDEEDEEDKDQQILVWDDDKNGFTGRIEDFLRFSYYIEELLSAQEYNKEYEKEKEKR